MSKSRLTRGDREFFAALDKIVFGNPFSVERAQKIARLVPDVPFGDLDINQEPLARVVERRLEPLLRGGAPALQRLEVEDRQLLEIGFLYACYHRYVPPIDALIERQVTQGGSSPTGPFADEAIARLGSGHVFGERRFAANFAESFIAINLSQYPETLIESELFGHRKGAFTGAIDHHAGVFERCSAYGALFLDEIGEVSIPVQIKLLQVLQERTFTALGGHEKRRFSGRVIAATNRRLDELRRDGRFRDDFFFRLCSDVIEVPTLA